MVRLTNISTSIKQIVCDLNSKGKDPYTLRLDFKQSEEVEDYQITPYINSLVAKGELKCEKVIAQEQTTNNSKKKVADDKQEKEEKEEK